MHFALHCDIFYQYVEASKAHGAKPRRFADEKNEKNVEPSTTIQGATPHHPLPIEGRPLPTCFRSVARTARKPPRPAHRERCARSRPPLRLCIDLRLGPPSFACVSLPPQVRRLRRQPFAAVAHPGYAVPVPRGAAHTHPALLAWLTDRLTCARRVGLVSVRTPAMAD